MPGFNLKLRVHKESIEYCITLVTEQKKDDHNYDSYNTLTYCVCLCLDYIDKVVHDTNAKYKRFYNKRSMRRLFKIGPKKDILGNTAAFMMITKELFQNIGGFDTSYRECFEDLQLNIECINRNKDNIFVGEAVCYHYESQTRNKDEKKARREYEDYSRLLIPFVVNNKKTYNYVG